MNKALWFVFVFSSCFYFFYTFNNRVKNTPQILVPQTQAISEPIAPEIVKNPIIEELNSNNSKIKSIYYPKINIKSSGLMVSSIFLYEKNKNFRMKNSSFFGPEADIGSNSGIFWFWSRRMRPSALFWAKHEDLHKTYLKTPFHPDWMMETIGINEVDTKDCFIFDYKNYVGIKQNRTDAITGQPVVRIFLIDKDKKAFFGHYLVDQQGNTLISFEVNRYHFVYNMYFPKSVNITWNQENIKLSWELDRPTINPTFNKENWILPNIKPQLELSDYVSKAFRVSSK